MSGLPRFSVLDPSVRLTDDLIMRHIPSGSRVIDLGCGDGRLMSRLSSELKCDVLGVDVEHQNIVSVVSRGLPAISLDLNEGLREIPDSTFDYAVLSQTLQQVERPRPLLLEMMRVAKRGLVVIPNFGHWRVRYEVLVHGRTPITEALPYEWHESPNLHFMSMYDFRALMNSIGMRIVEEIPINGGRAHEKMWAANLRADSAFYLLERNTDDSSSPQRPSR
ncbi:MAG: methionine biosynthesis protein MetW [Planctomycetaceae bacterium]|nr:methionine biosynthesis protein MetW [Planctomycetaceae bacterium]